MQHSNGSLVFGAILVGLTACSDSTGPNAGRFLNAAQVVVGDQHTCFLSTSGIARCWGWGTLGQLGDGDTLNRTAPVQVEGQAQYQFLAAGSNHSCGILEGGEAMCWGAAHAGELGNGADQGRVASPEAVLGGSRFSSLSVGDGHTCGITRGGDALCWGEGEKGQLGNAGFQNQISPVPVSSTLQFQSIAAGQLFTCGVSTQREAYCWGDNTWGQLGNGTFGGTSSSPSKVVGSHEFTDVHVGKSFVCALTTDQDALCWGAGSGGRLGHGQGADTAIAVPALVTDGHKFRSIALGRDHTCGVTTDLQAYCWGLNTYGKLGKAIGPSSREPVPVSGGLSFVGISVGVDHSCAVATSGRGYCWGQNLIGQLGRTGIFQSITPLEVVGL
jgi:alpha-tubulin suppressor-like RCC1 family protein